MNLAYLQTQLQLPYRRERWQLLLPELFQRVELFQRPVDYPVVAEAQRALASGMRQYGRIPLADQSGNPRYIALFEVDVATVGVDLLRNRVGLRELVARCIDEVDAHAVLAFFVKPGSPSYRLTYAARETTLRDDSLPETRETTARRYTYVLGPGESCRTAAERLASLAERRAHATLGDVTDAFSVERLSREFFVAYRNHYEAFWHHLIADDAHTRAFGITAVDDGARKPVRDFVKKLLGRLVFLHFLQKKSWLGCPGTAATWQDGDPRFLQSLFANCPDQERFYSQRLVPLFYDTLNNPARPNDTFAITGTRVPYLNGGLFERDATADDAVEFPAALFSGFLAFLDQYNFTIDENDPDDHEIGIDPEMLGHIFENLLEDNKEKGAYYTPKTIVRYMCQESLIHYLQHRFPGDAQAPAEIERLIRHKDPLRPQDGRSWLARHATQLEQLLVEIKICDPAIGSGAFPIGLLQEIFWTRLTLHPALHRAQTKRDIVQRCIYGVDIDTGAVEIARLRCWLALIVEEDRPRPLPNLDFKIMQGDSLVERFEGIALDSLVPTETPGHPTDGQTVLDLGVESRPDVEVALGCEDRRQFDQLLSQYFECTEPMLKLQLHAQIEALVFAHLDYNVERFLRAKETELNCIEQILADKRARLRDYTLSAKEARQLTRLTDEVRINRVRRDKLLALRSKPERPFFLWHLFFQDVFARGGFDIVIGNPPYVDSERMTREMPGYRKLLADTYTTTKGNWDLYVPFWERSLAFINDRGVACLLTPNKWLSISYGKALRGLIGRRIALLADLSKFRAFDSASVFTVVALATNTPSPTIRCDLFADGAKLRAQQRLSAETMVRLDNFGLALSEHADLVARLSNVGVPLADLAEVEEAFTVAEYYELTKILRDVDPTEQGVLRLVTTGGIEPFHTLWGIDDTRHDGRRYRCPAVTVEEFTAVFPRRAERARRPKIIISGLRHFEAFLDTDGWYLPAKSTVVVRDCKRPLGFVNAVLNSAPVRFFLREAYGSLAMDGGINFSPANVSRIPIPHATPEQIQSLVDLEAKAAATPLADLAPRMTEIDCIVGSLYGLNPQELVLVTSAG